MERVLSIGQWELGKRVLKGTFLPKVGRGWAVHVARMVRRAMHAEFSVENMKGTQNRKMVIILKWVLKK
jgi:hypothetical protein